MLSVESAVLEDRQCDAGPSSCVDDPPRLRCLRGQRLVNHHRDPRADTLPCLTSVKTAGSGKHNQI